jgi:Putative transposase/Transposase zinc-binding domain
MASATQQRSRYQHTAKRAPDWASAQHVYRPRRPTTTPLYPVVQHHLETFLAQATQSDPLGYGVTSWVEKDLRAYLRCGILAHGFARLRCSGCGHERLLAFSCKSRGICPSCNTRRMAEVAAHVTDHVLPQLPVRQWVLSLPKRLRPFLETNPDIAGAVLRIFMRAVRSTLQRTSPGAPRDAQLGAISFLHRFGSTLNTHFHFHAIVLDGVFSRGPDEEVSFHEAALLTPEHWHALQYELQRRVLRYFRRHGLLDKTDAHGMLSWQGSGGFSIDASVRIEGEDRAGVERLLRYCARPPFALQRLWAPGGIVSLASPESRLVYRLPGPTPDGRTELVLTPIELLTRLARLVPPPRIHRHRYHGVLAPNANLRAAVIHFGKPEAETPAAQLLSPGPKSSPDAEPARPSNPARVRWATLLARIYEVLPLLCPACGGQMKILAFLTDPPVVFAILEHLELPHAPPMIAPARGPPQGDFLLDQSPAFDPTQAEPSPEFVFDQSMPAHFDD